MVDSGHAARCPVCNAPLEPGATACRECGRPLQVPAARRVTPAAAAPAPAALPAFSEPGKKELGIAVSVWLGLLATLCLVAAVVLAVVIAGQAGECYNLQFAREPLPYCTTQPYPLLAIAIAASLAAAASAIGLGHSLGWRWRGRL